MFKILQMMPSPPLTLPELPFKSTGNHPSFDHPATARSPRTMASPYQVECNKRGGWPCVGLLSPAIRFIKAPCGPGLGLVPRPVIPFRARGSDGMPAWSLMARDILAGSEPEPPLLASRLVVKTPRGPMAPATSTSARIQGKQAEHEMDGYWGPACCHGGEILAAARRWRAGLMIL